MAEKVASGGGAWGDKERLVYLFALIEQSNVKLDFANTPRPNGRTLIACQRMFDRLKGTLKDDLEALKAGDSINEATVKTPKTPKRKKAIDEGDDNGETEATPTKRGRKKADVDPPNNEGEEDTPKKRGRGRSKKADLSDAIIKEEVEDHDNDGDEVLGEI